MMRPEEKNADFVVFPTEKGDMLLVMDRCDLVQMMERQHAFEYLKDTARKVRRTIVVRRHYKNLSDFGEERYYPCRTTQQQLAVWFNKNWRESYDIHPDYPAEDWVEAVKNGQTFLGYRMWALKRALKLDREEDTW